MSGLSIALSTLTLVALGVAWRFSRDAVTRRESVAYLVLAALAAAGAYLWR